MLRRTIAPLLAALLLGGCSLSSGLSKTTQATFSIYSVNGNSPDGQATFGIGGYKISIPRGSLILHDDGTVQEILQYVIIPPGNGAQIAATDTTYGHYELADERYDIRLPNADGGEAYAGSTNLATDFVELARSWRKNGIVVSVTIAYARSSTPNRM